MNEINGQEIASLIKLCGKNAASAKICGRKEESQGTEADKQKQAQGQRRCCESQMNLGRLGKSNPTELRSKIAYLTFMRLETNKKRIGQTIESTR